MIDGICKSSRLPVIILGTKVFLYRQLKCYPPFFCPMYSCFCLPTRANVAIHTISFSQLSDIAAGKRGIIPDG